MNIRKKIDYSEMYEELDRLMLQQLPQMELYCGIGRSVCRRKEKGTAVMASEYLNKRYPDVKGFSPRSLRRMRDFYRTYENHPALLSRAMQLGWIQNVVIMEADMPMELREWYIRATKQFCWSKTELIAMIASKVHLQIVLVDEEKICDNSNSEKEIYYHPDRNCVQLLIEKFVHRIVQQRCRGKPRWLSVSQYGGCLEISKNLTIGLGSQKRALLFRNSSMSLGYI